MPAPKGDTNGRCPRCGKTTRRLITCTVCNDRVCKENCVFDEDSVCCKQCVSLGADEAAERTDDGSE